MKLCFIGFGSMGKRHLKNIVFLLKQRQENYIIDLFKNHKLFSENEKNFISNHNNNLKQKDFSTIIDNNYQEIETEYRKEIHAVYYNIEELPKDYDIIFITNPTIYHYKTLLLFQDYAKHFFIEKPVFEHWNLDITKLNLHKDGIYYVACPLRYHPVIQYLKKNIDFKKVYCLRAISSSYLPDWRPKADYRKSYSARKDLGGGVAIDLIHEWDYISDLLTAPEEISSILDKVSNLEIDTEDIAVYIGKAGNTIIELHLDYFGRKSIRKIELFMEEDTITADLINNTITYEKSDKIISFKIERDDWQKEELAAFLDMIEGKSENINNIYKALKTLKLAKKT